MPLTKGLLHFLYFTLYNEKCSAILFRNFIHATLDSLLNVVYLGNFILFYVVEIVD